MTWVKALSQSALPEGTRQVVKLGDRKLLLLNHSGKLYALEDRCPHLKLSLKKGKITEDGAIVCPWHRSAFDLCTGDVKTWTPWPPGVGKVLSMVSSEKALPVFPTRVDEGNIWVDLDS